MKLKFEQLTDEKKRVAIAKDVLKYLQKDKIIASSFWYFLLNLRNLKNEIKNDELNKYLLKSETICKVCSKGALMFAYMLKTKSYEIKDLQRCGNIPEIFELHEKKIKNALKNVFSIKQLDMIETAFETMVYSDSTRSLRAHRRHKSPTKLAFRCIDFGTDYPNQTERLVGIMKNIIKNNGEFIP